MAGQQTAAASSRAAVSGGVRRLDSVMIFQCLLEQQEAVPSKSPPGIPAVLAFACVERRNTNLTQSWIASDLAYSESTSRRKRRGLSQAADWGRDREGPEQILREASHQTDLADVQQGVHDRGE